MINYQKSDINYQLAYDAHRGTSFTPDVRADQVISSYMAEMKAISEKFSKFATPENEAALTHDLERFRQKYLGKFNALLSAKSRCMSTMIAGPSGFNRKKSQKANDTEHKRTQEFLSWKEKALQRLNLDYNPVAIARRPVKSDEFDAIERLQEKIDSAEKLQSLMKSANKIVRRKKGDVEGKVTELMALGISKNQSRSLFTPDFAGRVGFPGYQLTNNNANIRRMKTRIATLQAELDRPETEDKAASINGEAVTVVENRDIQRLQLIFDGKPNAETRKKLKGYGFRWAKSEGAWQRLLNSNARHTLDNLLLDS